MHVLMKGTGRLTAGRAVKYLRRLAGGGEIALTGAFRGASPAAPLLGPDEVRPWLGTLDGVVMVIHDDVTIGDLDIETLTETHTSSGAPTAPEARCSETDPAHIPVLLGQPSQVEAVLFEVGVETAGLLERVKGLSTDHELACAEHRNRPLLVASMIVRDEEEQIGDCLASLAGAVDRVEILDTGSVDDTVAVARALGASVTTATWDDDFGAARNRALDLARDARFVLHIDADERLAVPDIDAFRSMLETTEHVALRVSMRNVVDDRVTSEFDAVRIFSTVGTTWEGKVHEFPADLDGNPLPSTPIGGISIDHHGYDPRIVAEKDKWNRNVRLAEAAYRERPSFKTRLDLARSLAWRSDEARAFDLFKEAAADLTGASPGAAAFVIAHVALAHQIDGDIERAHSLAEEAIGYCSGEFVAHLARARAWRDTRDDQAIIDAHTWRTERVLEPPMFDTAATRAMVDNLTAGALARLGHHVEAIEMAVTVLDRNPLRFDEWKSLARMPQVLRETSLPLLASMDRSGSFADALVGEIPMGELAALTLAHTQACTPAAHTVITGVMAAVLAGDEPTAATIAEAGRAVLGPEQRSATAERCRLRGASTVADVLETSTV